MKKPMLIIHQNDNVGVLLKDGEKGDIFYTKLYKVKLIENIKFSHKVALKNIPKGTDIIKYGLKIGIALNFIKKGQWVHNHNIMSKRGKPKI